MTEVRWSGAIHVYVPDSRLNDFLADVERLIESPVGAAPAYLAIRFADDDWYVVSVVEAVHLQGRLSSYHAESALKARLRSVADILKGVCTRATLLTAGRSRSSTLPPMPATGACYVIELDARGAAKRVGALTAQAASAQPASAPTRSGTRSIRPYTDDAEAVLHQMELQRMQQRDLMREQEEFMRLERQERSIGPRADAVEAERLERLRMQQDEERMRHQQEEYMLRQQERSGSAPPDPAEFTGAEPPPEAQAPRYIQGDLYRKAGSNWLPSEPELAIKHKYRFDVFIGPPGLGSIQADTAFRDDALDWSKAESYRLQVVFAAIGGDAEAQSAFIDLPRTGRSSTCSFHFSPKRLGPFNARISVLHEGRVLQTAVIQTVVEPLPRERRGPGDSPALRPAVEMVVRHDLGSLDDRQRFDACLILNHAKDGSAAMTAASSDGAYVSSLDDLQAQLASISTLLVELATKSKIHTKGLATKDNAAWLGRLAAEGNFLYRKLVVDYIAKSPAAEALRNAEYLQIVSARPDAVVPLEFVYEYPPPKKGAPVCENAAQALRDGRCPASCKPKRSPADRVCPMGFWGLSRVIERHVHDPQLPKPAKICAVEPTAARKALEVRGTSLLAVSEQVKAAERKKLADRVKQHWKGGVSVVERWESWPDTVSAKRPVLFVVLPHTKGKGAEIALEIAGDALESRYIERSYVYPEDSSASPPIVLLLGCDTSNTADKDAYTTNIAVFRQAGSAIVLATTAALVWGEDSAKVAGQIVEAFDAAVTGSAQRFGEILRTAKRRSVADSQLMAMCVAAFGDADWQLSAKQGT